jgi:hypothetical protein
MGFYLLSDYKGVVNSRGVLNNRTARNVAQLGRMLIIGEETSMMALDGNNYRDLALRTKLLAKLT